MLKNVCLIENIENLCLWFFSILKAVYKFSLPLNMCWIRKRCPHLPENKLCHSQFYESDNKTLKLKVLKNLKICAFDFFYCEPIFDVIRISNSCVYQKTLPAIFEKKRLSLSLLCLSKFILKVENGHAVQHLAPPG